MCEQKHSKTHSKINCCIRKRNKTNDLATFWTENTIKHNRYLQQTPTINSRNRDLQQTLTMDTIDAYNRHLQQTLTMDTCNRHLQQTLTIDTYNRHSQQTLAIEEKTPSFRALCWDNCFKPFILRRFEKLLLRSAAGCP